MKVLDEVEVDRKLADNACKKRDLILSLKFSYGSGMEDMSLRIRLFSVLIGSWPSLTQGGGRYLLQGRGHFIHQMEILTKMNFGWLDGYYSGRYIYGDATVRKTRSEYRSLKQSRLV